MVDLGCEHSKGSVPGLASGVSLSCPSCALQKMVESQRQNVLGEFERLRRLLAEEEQQLLQKLEEEELEVLPRLREGAARLGQQSTQLAALVSELESRCQLPALGLLQVSGLDGMSRRSLRGHQVCTRPPTPLLPIQAHRPRTCLPLGCHRTCSMSPSPSHLHTFCLSH